MRNRHWSLLPPPRSVTGTVAMSNQVTGNRGRLRSGKRGHIAVMYTGSARAFSSNFRSHIANVFAGCPYTVHLFVHSWAKDLRFGLEGVTQTDAIFTEKLRNGSHAADRTIHVPSSSPHYSTFSSFRSINSTLDYMVGWRNLDGELVCAHEAVKGFMV